MPFGPLSKITLTGSDKKEKIHIEREPAGGFVIGLYVGSPCEMNCRIAAADAPALAEILASGQPVKAVKSHEAANLKVAIAAKDDALDDLRAEIAAFKTGQTALSIIELAEMTGIMPSRLVPDFEANLIPSNRDGDTVRFTFKIAHVFAAVWSRLEAAEAELAVRRSQPTVDFGVAVA